MVKLHNAPKLIKMDPRDKVNGFYTLFISNYSIVCLPDNEYIVPVCMVRKLREQKIRFKLIKKKWQ